jgi:hypothetical protein
MISHQSLQSNGLQPIYLSRYLRTMPYQIGVAWLSFAAKPT